MIDEGLVMKLMEGDYDADKFEELMAKVYDEDFYNKDDAKWKTDVDVKNSLGNGKGGEGVDADQIEDDGEGYLYDNDGEDEDQQEEEEEHYPNVEDYNNEMEHE